MQRKNVKAAVLLLKLKSEECDEILFEVRSANVMQPHEICMPGGHIEDGENPEETALRECEEEIGIPKEDIHIEGRLEDEMRLFGGKVAVIVGNCDKKILEKANIDRTEVDSVFTIPTDWLKTYEIHSYTFDTDKLDNVENPLPPILKNYLRSYKGKGETFYIEYNGHGIWGLTARILVIALKTGLCDR